MRKVIVPAATPSGITSTSSGPSTAAARRAASRLDEGAHSVDFRHVGGGEYTDPVSAARLVGDKALGR